MTATERDRRERVRMEAAERFARGEPVARVAADYTIPGVWFLLRRRGWSCQRPARRAVEREDGAVAVWRGEVWERVKR